METDIESLILTLPTELQAKARNLLGELRSFGSCVIAFSGGIDSSLLAKAARMVLGERVLAVTAVMQSMSEGRLAQCAEAAAALGVPFLTVEIRELDDWRYRQNDERRCYYCKRILFERLQQVAASRGLAVVVDGSNVDDLTDWRPGAQAIEELGIRRPLVDCGITKAEVRQVARAWQVPDPDRPSTTCLSTRIAYGLEITPDRLKKVDRAEQFLQAHGFSPLRVRYHPGELARIEIPPEMFPRLLEPEFRARLIDVLKAAGFKFVTLDLEGFRSGSMNALIQK